ncbi:hypothetical protein PRZ48_002722 [Zasmidium cellare]|uniref:Ankyrin repeat protein n=1 Tax=Zasmidium cellare TaxID=395010 RepID=A0ABR0EU18_ZASCE|nr:hypothetical protein PRZ48_002722 [Zasmidium cellare]
MDPLTAFSLASGVAQLLSFAGALVSAGNEIYRAADGVLLENKDSEEVAKDLQELSSEVSDSQARLLTGQSLGPDEWRLRVIADNCTSIATELITRLDKLKVQGKNRRLKSYKQALMSVWQKDELEKVADRLEKYQRELDTRILFSLRKRLEGQDVRQTEQFKTLDKRAQDLMIAILDGGDRIDIHLTNQDGVLSKILSGQDQILSIVNDRARSPSPAPPYERVASPSGATTTLHEAAKSGDTTQVRKLIRSGAVDVNAKDEHGCTALHLVANADSAKRILSDRQIDLNAEDADGRTALHHAVLKRRADIVRLLLEAGVDKTLEDDKGRTAAFYAVVFPTASWMLRYGHSISARATDHLNNTGLFQLAWIGDVEGTEYFLKNGADVNATNMWNETALTEASRHGDVKVVSLLLSHGGNPDHAGNSQEWTPLLQAVRDNRIEVVPLLLRHGAKLDPRLKSGNNALAEACFRGHLDIARLLVEAGSHVETLTHQGATPLLYASFHGDAEFAKFLLDRGANKEAQGTNGYTPLNKAAERGHPKVLQALLERGATAYTKSKEGFTPMSVAARNGHLECVELLLDAGVDANVQGHRENTPLAEAALAPHSKIAELLISRGARLEIPTDQGFTALCVAASKGADDIVKTLIKSGANIEAAGHAHKHPDWQNTPLLRAAWFGHPTTIAILVELGADIETRDYFGRTALNHAVRHNHTDSVKTLIQKGADVNSQSRDGTSPLHCAAQNGSEELCRILVDAGANPWLRNWKNCTPWIIANHHATDGKVGSVLRPKETEYEDFTKLSEKLPGEIAEYLDTLFSRSSS